MAVGDAGYPQGSGLRPWTERGGSFDAVGNSGVSRPPVPYLGAVASRCGPPMLTAAQTKLFARTKHHAMEDLSAIALVYSAWRLDGGVYELNIDLANYAASIEYPIGSTPTPVLFSGQYFGVVPAGEDLRSDMTPLPVVIPRGAAFYVRTFQTGATISYHTIPGLAANADSGEFITFGSGSVDLTRVTTNLANQQGGIAFRPTAIVGFTTRPTFLLTGDSRCNAAAYDVVTDGFGLSGELERPLGMRFGTINVGIQGEKLSTAVTSFTKRLRLLQYTSAVACNYGINDLVFGGGNATTLSASVVTFAALHGKPHYHSTLSPNATTSNAYADLAGQTVGTGNAQRVLFNNMVRALKAPLTGYLEIADVVESSRDSGLFKSVVQAPAITLYGSTFSAGVVNGDALHINGYGGHLIQANAGLPPTLR